MNIWSRILEWYYDTRDRQEYIIQFNRDFKKAYRLGHFPLLLKANVCSGNRDNSTQFSRNIFGISRSGLKIEAMSSSNFFLNKHVATMLALVILSNDRMCRDLLSMGFDTLWVGKHSWKLQEYSLPPHPEF